MKSTAIQRAAADEYAVFDDGDMKSVVDAGKNQDITYEILVSELGNTLSAFIYGEAQSAGDLKELARMLRSGARELTVLADRLEERSE